MESIRISASTDAVTLHSFTKVCSIVLVSGIDAASALIYDAVTQTGTDRLSVKCPATDCRQIELEDGVTFRNGISVTLSGTNPVLYLIVE